MVSAESGSVIANVPVVDMSPLVSSGVASSEILAEEVPETLIALAANVFIAAASAAVPSSERTLPDVPAVTEEAAESAKTDWVK